MARRGASKVSESESFVTRIFVDPNGAHSAWMILERNWIDRSKFGDAKEVRVTVELLDRSREKGERK